MFSDFSICSAVFAQLTKECPYTLQWTATPPKKCPFSLGDRGPHLILGSLGRNHWTQCSLITSGHRILTKGCITGVHHLPNFMPTGKTIAKIWPFFKMAAVSGMSSWNFKT